MSFILLCKCVSGWSFCRLIWFHLRLSIIEMRAIVIPECGGPEVLKISEIAIPEITPIQILVRNHVAGVNYIDCYHRSGLYAVPLPYTPGREAAGIIEKVGSQVSGWKVGDRVCYCGAGTYAEYTAVDPKFCIALPASITSQQGACLLLQGLTSIVLSSHCHKVTQGETVLIHASAGGMGLLLVQLCKLAGATVIGTASTADKASVATQAGADHVILYTSDPVAETVLKLTNNAGVDCVFDGVGKSTFDESLKCLKRLGSMVSFGNASGAVDPVPLTKLVPRCIRLMRPSLFEFLKTREDFEQSKFC